MPRCKPIIGIVGGIGSGKSTVARMLADLGCLVIDADVIGHDLLREPAIREQVVRLFGPGVLDAAGEVARKAVARLVFDDADALAKLNALMHPAIADRINQRIAAAMEDDAVVAVVLDAAVLFEAGWDRICTTCIYIQAPNSIRAARVKESRGWDEAAWRSRENSQISLDTKALRCEYTLDNSSDISHLCLQVQQVLHRILKKSSAC